MGSPRGTAGTAGEVPAGAGALRRHSTVWVEELTTRTRSCWGGARELAASLVGKGQRETRKQAQPKGARLGRRFMEVTVLGCHGRRAAGKSTSAWPDLADPIGSTPGLCQLWLLKF